ncbi:hypothetical protein [Chroococcidiopsis sp. TS-821]|uniref:hypothetical protein n=1 Tax=Chroococcidiopsis sp. TS-821 TaxID=1378066 RepID=UPI000CEF24C5|nr:hypothetical protein [Chroococcidiopsis sp. TS-821]PPS42754.1 hypothetical protein B1A85_13640 [Chroococcidiopsis sp. TS-821]
MYYLPEPPYFLMIAGFLVSLTSGSAFGASLKQIVQNWSSDRISSMSSQLPTVSLVVPFVGMTIGVYLFLSAGLEVFGFPGLIAYVVALPLTLFLGILIWRQLGSMLTLAEKEGFAAIDIDSWR